MSDRVIFVDDDEKYLMSLKRYLSATRVDWVTDFWSNEVQALERIKTEKSAVIVLDMAMPQIDGATFCRHIREISTKTGTRFHIIMLTGTVGPAATINALEWGADDYLTKPMDLDSLRIHITLGLTLINS